MDQAQAAERIVVSEFEALVEEARALNVPRGTGAALCFSGGGIRSASFCLGLTQALARANVLHRFDYLSTVSGGGYIGGWLQQILAGSKGGDRAAQARNAEARLRGEDIPELGRLRDFTNYLTPRTGAASPDTWAGVALYGRNFLVNWVVFLPVFLLIALLPIMHRTTIWAAGAHVWLVLTAILVAFAAMGVSVAVAARWVPSQRHDEMMAHIRDEGEAGSRSASAAAPDGEVGEAEARARKQRTKDVVARQAHARHIATGTAVIFAVTLPIALQYLLGAGWFLWVEPEGAKGWHYLLRAMVGNAGLPFCFFVTLLIAFFVARSLTPRRSRSPGLKTSTPRALFDTNLEPWCWAAGVSALVFALLLQVLFWNRATFLHPVVDKPWDWIDARADVLTLGAPLVLMGVLMAHVSLYIGWRREARYGDLDREWLARLNGTTMGCVVAWTLFSTACIVPSRWITLPAGQVSGVNITLSGLSAIASGFLSSWLGKQAVSRATSAVQAGRVQQLLGIAQIVLPLIFVVALFAFLSALIQDILGFLGDKASLGIRTWNPSSVWLDGGDACDRVWTAAGCTSVGRWLPVLLQVFLGGLLVLALLKLATVVNVNRFSMHAVYRNRLVRAFLGTPRDPATRQPDPFTGFDDHDNPRLTTVAQGGPLYPVVNMTLNITTGERGSWAERKGASFVATPLRCGSGALGDDGAYVMTSRFGGMETEYDEDGRNKGIHLGSVITISGAAASPNWGYHSNPMVALLMTLFNVRLGAWYGNPAKADEQELQLSKPADSIGAMLDELTGTARGDGKAIYLSDGGHFENLGVYEMLKRRCRRILVIDAGQDEKFGFFDLGMLIRKAEIDLPVKIDVPARGMMPRTAVAGEPAAGARGFAFGTITYFLEEGRSMTGEIIYVKPTLLAAVPASVVAYANENPLFPHESTVDQFFSESQFESYRALGEYQGQLMVGPLPLPGDDPLAALFERVKAACAG